MPSPRVSAANVPYGKIRTAAEVGALVRARRRAAGMTQAHAAGLCGVGVRFLGDLERGKATVELAKVLQVLQRMGLDVTIVPRGTRS